MRDLGGASDWDAKLDSEVINLSSNSVTARRTACETPVLVLTTSVTVTTFLVSGSLAQDRIYVYASYILAPRTRKRTGRLAVVRSEVDTPKHS